VNRWKGSHGREAASCSLEGEGGRREKEIETRREQQGSGRWEPCEKVDLGREKRPIMVGAWVGIGFGRKKTGGESRRKTIGGRWDPKILQIQRRRINKGMRGEEQKKKYFRGSLE